MSVWRQLRHGVRGMVRRAHADRDIADELTHYLERATAAGVARGLTVADARRAARLELGNVTMVREQVRGYGWENVVTTFLTDLRIATRRLRAHAGFTAVAVTTLALGIGATTAIFSAVNPILFRSLPYPEADRVVTIWDVGNDGARGAGTFATYSELAIRNRAFDAISVFKPWQASITGDARPERLDGQRVSASYFRVIGVAPQLGRAFDASDDRLNGPRVVVLSDALWRRRFDADQQIIGRAVTLNDERYTVVGVMPAGYENVLAPSAALWAPLQYDMSEGRAWGHHLRTAGRLRAGVSVEFARQDINAIATSLIIKQPQAFGHPALGVSSMQADITRGVKPALVAVLVAVLLVLLIACVNVMNLLLARGAERRGEMAMRAALGAGRQRLVRQLLTESLLLAMIGGVAGLMVAEAGVRALVSISPPELPRVQAIGVDGTVFLFAFALTTVVGLVFGLVPALQATRSDVGATLQRTSQRTTGGHHRLRRSLVVAEVALALVLLVSSGLLLRSLQQLFAIAPGFDASQLLTMQVQTNGQRFANDSVTHRFFDAALSAVERVPGVLSAAVTSQLPLSGDNDVYGVQLELDNVAGADHSAFRYAVSPRYLETMRIPLRRGRLLDAYDMAGAPPAVVVNESFARHRLNGRDPIGQHVHVGPTNGPWYTVVGVVGDVKQLSLALGSADAVYVTTAQWPFADPVLSLVVRARVDAATLSSAVRQAVWSVDKDQPISNVATMESLLARSTAERRFALMLFASFAMVALVLAAAGIYGVLAGSVTERAREIGVRAALGASRTDIRNLVLRQGMRLAVIGTTIGVVGAMMASRGIMALLFGISPLDLVTYVAVIALLLAVSAVACWVPAWRASRIDPAVTLRAE